MMEVIIQMATLIIAVLAIVLSQWSDRKQRKLQMYAEYTRRYQDIFMNMPDDIYNGTAEIDERTKRYMRLYYSLCSEEYQLWQQGFVKEGVWELWVDGMQIETSQKNYKIFHDAWNAIKKEYNIDFRNYFEKNVINHRNEKK